VRHPLREQLERHVTIETGVAREIDLAHPPGAQWAEDLVGTQTGARIQPHARQCKPGGTAETMRARDGTPGAGAAAYRQRKFAALRGWIACRAVLFARRVRKHRGFVTLDEMIALRDRGEDAPEGAVAADARWPRARAAG